MLESILILMSTYNGELFLREQLTSIFQQNNVCIKLLIRDDGSIDSTLNILKEFKIKYKSIEIIEGKNIGWRKSFMNLVQYAAKNYPEFQYFAFADQDDIWLPDKLNHGINQLNHLPKGANLYCSNLYYYKNGVNYGIIRRNKIEPTFKSCLIRNYATGCTMIFNLELLLLAAREVPNIIIAHDYWLYLIAVLCGNVYVDEEAHILYRQHSNNQIGSKSSYRDIWKRRCHNLKKSFTQHERENQAKELMRLFSKEMYPDALKATSKLANYRKSIPQQIALLKDKAYSFGSTSNDRWLKAKIVLRIL